MSVIAFCETCPGLYGVFSGQASTPEVIGAVMLIGLIILAVVIMISGIDELCKKDAERLAKKNQPKEVEKEVEKPASIPAPVPQEVVTPMPVVEEVRKDDFDKSDAIDIDADIVEEAKALPSPQTESSWNAILNKSRVDILREKAWDKMIAMQERINKLQEQQLNTPNHGSINN